MANQEKIEKRINSGSNSKYNKNLMELLPCFLNLYGLERERLVIMRDKLNCLRQKTRGTKGDYLVSTSVRILKDITDEKPSDRGRHFVSDHAFVRYFERVLGLDVNHIKNKIAEDVKNKQVSHIVYNGKMITILGGEDKK